MVLYKSVVNPQTNLKGTRPMHCAKSSSVPKVQLFFSADHLANPFCISGPMVMHKLFTINYLELRGWALSSHNYSRVRSIVPEMFQSTLNIIYTMLAVYLTDLYETIQNQAKGVGIISSKKKGLSCLLALLFLEEERERNRTKLGWRRQSFWKAFCDKWIPAIVETTGKCYFLYFYFSKHFGSPPYSTVPRYSLILHSDFESYSWVIKCVGLADWTAKPECQYLTT